MKASQTAAIHFGSKLLGSILGLLSTIYFSRILGAGIVGKYYLVLTVISWLGLVCQFGVTSGMEKRISEGNDQSPYIIAGLVLIFISFSVVAILSVNYRGLLANFIGGRFTIMIILILFTSLCSACVESILKGLDLVHLSGVLVPARSAIQSLLQISVLFVGLRLNALFASYAVGSIFITGIGVILIFQTVKKFQSPNVRHFKRIISFAKFSSIGGLRAKTFQSADILILGYFVSSSLVGIYSIVWTISAFLLIFSNSLSQTLFPKMSRLSTNRNSNAVSDIFEDSLAYSGLFLIPGLIGGIFIGEMILGIYGSEFVSGSSIFVILLISTTIQGYQAPYLTALNGIDRPDLAFRSSAVFIVTNLTLNCLLIWSLGWVGAAVATMISAAVCLIYAHVILSSLINFTIPTIEIFRQWISAGLMGAALFFTIRFNQVINIIQHDILLVMLLIILGVIVYFNLLIGISSRFRTTVFNNILRPILAIISNKFQSM